MSNFDFGVPRMSEHIVRVEKVMQKMAPKYIDGPSRLLGARGKRMRPSIVIATAHYGGRRTDEEVLKLAAAVELVHLSSLIHDDIMDRGTIRWGEPTINSYEGNDMALLAGDYLLASAVELASEVGTEAASIVTKSIMNLCEGQALEMRDRHNLNRSEASLRRTAEKKTATLFVASFQLGALLGQYSDSDKRILDRFSRRYGVAFQYRDDITDFIADSKAAGKSVGSDLREGNYTLPILIALKGLRAPMLREMLKTGTSMEHALSLLREEDALNHAQTTADKYLHEAISELNKFSHKHFGNVLTKFSTL